MPSSTSRRTLITGPAGSGKTHAILEEVLGAVRGGTAESTLCLLPTYGQVEHIKRRFVSIAEAAALFDPPFLTFTGLYERLLPGRRIRHLASLMERRRLMERAIQREDVPAFRRAAKTPGFRERALAVVKEIRENGLSSAEVRREIESQFEASERIRGFLRIALAYEGGLREAEVVDHEGALLQILEAIEEGKGAELTLLAVDGFANFTRLEFRIFEALTGRTDRCLVTLPRDEARAGTLFRISAPTRDALIEMGFREQRLEEIRRTGSAALRHIVSGLFSERQVPVEAEGHVARIIGGDRASEVDLIAREIGRIRRGEVKACSGDPPKLQQIGVIVRRLDLYRDVIPAVFARHRIPVRLVQDPLPLRSEPILRHALAYLGAVSGCFEGEPFLGYLRSGHVSVGGSTLHDSERDRIRRSADRISEAVRLEGTPDTLARLLEMGPRRDSAFSRLAEFLRTQRDTLDVRGPATEMAARVADALAWGICTSFEARRGDSSGDSLFWQDRYRKESVALAALGEAIREAGSPLLWEGKPVSAGDLVRAVSESAIEGTAPLRDRRLNCVNVIDAREARHWDSLRVVFAAGLIEREFPLYPREDIFIRDRERRRLNEKTRLSLRENLQQRDEERYLFYVASTRARELLYLCHPSHDPDGKEMQTSFYVGDLLRLFADDGVEERRASLARPCPPPEEATLPQDLEMEVARSIGPEAEASDLALALYHTAPDRGMFRFGIDFLRTGGDPLHESDLLGAIGSRMRTVSPHSINKFLRCPRLHFITKILGVREPGPGLEERLDPMEVGRIAHAVLERYHGEGGKRTIDAVISEVVEEDLERLDLGVRREVLLRRLRQVIPWTLQRERRDEGPFRPAYLEKNVADEGISLPHESGPILLGGKIDRIDTAEVGGKKYCLVVDYKLTRGFHKTDLESTEAIEGMDDIQILFYAAAARRLTGLPVAGAELFPLESEMRGGIYLKRLEEALVGRFESKHSALLSEEEMDALLQRCEEQVIEVVGQIRGGAVAREPADPMNCTPDGCEAFLVCRPDRSALLRAARAREREEE